MVWPPALIRLSVPGPEILPERLIFPVMSAASVAPEAMETAVVREGTVEFAIPLASTRVPEFTVVVPVYVVVPPIVKVAVPASVRPEDPPIVLLIVALALAVMAPEVLVMVPPVRVKFPLAEELKARDWAVCVPETVTVPAAPVPGLPPKIAAAPACHNLLVTPLLMLQLPVTVFQVPLPLSVRLLLAVLSQV